MARWFGIALAMAGLIGIISTAWDVMSIQNVETERLFGLVIWSGMVVGGSISLLFPEKYA